MFTYIKANIILTLKIAALSAVIILIVYILINKVEININTTSNSQAISNSYSSSGSLAVGYIGGDSRGDWEIKKNVFSWSNINDVELFLKTLSPIQYCFSKVVVVGSSIIIFYPEIIDNKSTKTEPGKSSTSNSSTKRTILK